MAARSPTRVWTASSSAPAKFREETLRASTLTPTLVIESIAGLTELL
ncbi:MAG: hypothetical protein ACR2H2_02100 [Solirubrobacteraceae bacterium]